MNIKHRLLLGGVFVTAILVTMNSLSYDGLTYVKATILAKKFHYTTDYIGQLCRQGKVDAQLVGRAWFVTEQSLTAHKKDRHKDTRPAEILSKNKVNHVQVVGEKVSVYPVLTKRIHRQLSGTADFTTPPPMTHFAKRVATYSPDDGHLRPEMVKPAAPKSEPDLRVAEPVHTVRVRKEGNASSVLEFSPLPEVSLRGNLSVYSLDTEDQYPDPTPVVDLPVRIVPDPVSPISFAAARHSRIEPVVQTQHRQAVVTAYDAKFISLPVVDLESEPQPEPGSDIATDFRKQTTPWFFIPLMLLLSLLSIGVVFALTAHIESTATTLNQDLSFSLARVIEVIHLFY